MSEAGYSLRPPRSSTDPLPETLAQSGRKLRSRPGNPERSAVAARLIVPAVIITAVIVAASAIVIAFAAQLLAGSRIKIDFSAPSGRIFALHFDLAVVILHFENIESLLRERVRTSANLGSLPISRPALKHRSAPPPKPLSANSPTPAHPPAAEQNRCLNALPAFCSARNAGHASRSTSGRPARACRSTRTSC